MSKYQDDGLYTLFRRINAVLAKGTKRKLTFRPGQSKILMMLIERGTTPQATLMRELGIKSSSLYELLDKLQAEGFVDRERSEYRKAINVTITKDGRIAALENELAIKEREMTFFGVLDRRDKEDLERILNILLDGWREAGIISPGAEDESQEAIVE